MNILTFSKAPWDETNSVGNTFSNWFSGWDDCSFSHITTRLQKPNHPVRAESFVISETGMLKGLLRPGSVGQVVSGGSGTASLPDTQNGLQARFLSLMHRHPLSLVYLASDLLWQSGVWRNQKLDDFISKASPDIFFAFLDDFYMLAPLVNHVRKKTHAKVVFFIADDVYARGMRGPVHSLLARRNRRLFKELLHGADKLYGASPKLCSEYAQRFGVTIQPLYKGCGQFAPLRGTNSLPLQVLYAGNLLYGRDLALVDMAETLHTLAAEMGVPGLALHIYTPTETADSYKTKLASWGASVHPPRPYEEIVRLLSQADIILHVESADPREVRKTRLSFSTKIIDALQSGALMAAYGPEGIASMEYIKGIPGALAAHSKKDLEMAFREILRNPASMNGRKQAIREFALKNHQLQAVQRRLQTDFKELIAAAPAGGGHTA